MIPRTSILEELARTVFFLPAVDCNLASDKSSDWFLPQGDRFFTNRRGGDCYLLENQLAVSCGAPGLTHFSRHFLKLWEWVFFFSA